MKVIILILASCIGFPAVSQSTDSVTIYSNPDNVKLSSRQRAQLILQDKVRPSDNDFTFAILDSILSQKQDVRDFYFPVFVKILYKADGALSEVLGSYALKYIKSFSVEFSERYECCPTDKCCEDIAKIATYCTYEIMLRENWMSERKNLTLEISRHYPNWKKNKTISYFLLQLDKAIAAW